MNCNNVVYGGFNDTTSKKMQLDAGAYFKNWVYGTDTYATAKASGKLIGATQGGGTFSAIPEIRVIDADGVKGEAKGLLINDKWEVMMNPNFLETSKETIKLALMGTEITTDDFYEQIKAKNFICDDDYIDNITFVGKISGSLDPIIIQMFNVLNRNGLSLTSADKSQGILAMELKATYDPGNLDNPPFIIYLPKETGTVSGVVEDTAVPVAGATVTITIDTQEYSTLTATDGTFTLTVPYGLDYTVTATLGAKTGNATNIDVVPNADTDAGTIAIV